MAKYGEIVNPPAENLSPKTVSPAEKPVRKPAAQTRKLVQKPKSSRENLRYLKRGMV
jgi:hypothetical protein